MTNSTTRLKGLPWMRRRSKKRTRPLTKADPKIPKGRVEAVGAVDVVVPEIRGRAIGVRATEMRASVARARNAVRVRRPLPHDPEPRTRQTKTSMRTWMMKSLRI
jgi:hypothetical protein